MLWKKQETNLYLRMKETNVLHGGYGDLLSDYGCLKQAAMK